MIVVAQLSPEATARIVDRWQELEAEVAKPLSGSSLMPAALIEAERTLNERDERLKAQAIQIEDMSEDLGALERIAPAFSLKSNRGV